MNTSAQAVNFNMDKFQASHFMDAAEDNSMALIKASQFCSKFAQSNRATVKQVTKKVHRENYTKYVWK